MDRISKSTKLNALSYKFSYRLLFLLSLAWLTNCTEKEEPVLPINFLGGTINSAVLTDGIMGIEPEVTIALTFSARLDPASFEQSVQLDETGGGSATFSVRYAAGSSRAELIANLDRSSTYRLSLSAGEVGANGERLETPREWTFTTVGDEVITEQAPCITAAAGCRETIPISTSSSIQVFTSFPLLAENRRWEKITNAIIVVHGQNRNADTYFQDLTNVLQQTGLSESTILLAPHFAEQGSGDALFWTDRRWRIGENSDDASGVSSFTVVDDLIGRLGDTERFPVLEKVLVTGHSSGGAYTQLYAVANGQEEQFPGLQVLYMVANSQYFYYPEDVRWNSNTESFEAVDESACPDYRFWPYGFSRIPDYLSGNNQEEVNNRYAQRSVTYLLGTDDVVTTGSLNTRDCAAVLLGEHRYARGQLIHQLMETYFPESEEHDRLDVPGVGHNATSMYGSGQFQQRLSEIFE